MRFVSKVALVAVLLSLMVGSVLQAPTAHAGNNPRITFLNNTATPLRFGVDDTSGYICRVVVQYGSCSTSVSVGSHTVFAKTDGGTVVATDSLYAEIDGSYTWSIDEQK